MNLFNLKEAFLLKLQFNLKAEASKHYLNYVWWILEPALFVTAFYFVFEVLMRRGGEGFLVFLLLGKVPFLWFSRSVSNASSSILNGRGLIQQMAIPKSFFPILIVAQDLVKQTAVFVVLLAVVAGMGYAPSVTWLLLPVLIATQVLLITACALLTAAIVPFVPDFRFVVSTGMTLLMFGSGIFYDYNTVLLERHKELFLMNPLARLIEGYRDALMRDAVPDMGGLIAIAMLSAVAIALLLSHYRRKDAVYARLVIQ
ncbi:MAG: ABC transporter permease [Pseudomonadota bacterium]